MKNIGDCSLDSIKLRFYRPGDEKDIVDLFAIVYGKNISLDWWKWRYLDNTVDKPQVALAYCSGKLVAHYAVSPVVLCQNGISLKCAQSMTTMTHPDYEGKGLFVNLAKMVFDKLGKEGYQFVYSFPNQKSHGIFISKLNWIDIGTIPMLQCDLNNLIKFKFDGSTFDIRDISEIFMLSKIFKTDKICADFSASYLRWRFSKDSGNNYKFIQSGPESGGSSLIIFKQYGNKSIDLVHMVGEPKSLIVLINKLIFYGIKHRISVISTWCNIHSALHIQLERLGFAPIGGVTYFSALDISKNDFALSLQNWDINMSLSDIF